MRYIKVFIFMFQKFFNIFFYKIYINFDNLFIINNNFKILNKIYKIC